MAYAGGCRCGAIRYSVEGTPHHVALCHCRDCQLSAGAPAVSFAAFDAGNLTILQGTPFEHNSAGASIRSFCGTCGTSLFYRNEDYLPGLIDFHTATLDEPEALPPSAHIQAAERLDRMGKLDALPSFERYP